MGETISTRPDWHNKTILVVEDEDHNYAYIFEILKRTKAVIIRAENGVKAVEKVKQGTIDVVLMDIKLPEMDGYKATMEIKKLNPSLPVIAQTAFAMERERIECMNAGCDDYLAKPYEPSKLIERIRVFLP